MLDNRLRYIGLFLFFITFFSTHVHAQQGVPDSEYERKLVDFQQFLQAGRMEEGVSLLEQLIRDYPSKPEAYYAKSLIYAQAGEYDQAIELAQEVLALRPSDFTYGNHLINLYKATNNTSGVLEVLDTLARHHLGNKLIQKEKILFHYMVGDPGAALSAYDEAIAKFGVSDTLDVAKAEVLIGEERYHEVITLLEKWYNQKSLIKEVYGYLAMAYGQSGSTKKAVAVVENGLTITADERLYFDLADLYSSANEGRLMYTALKKGFESAGIDYGEKHRVMSFIANNETILTNSQKMDLSNTLIVKYPRVPDNYVFKGDVLWQAGQLGEARSLYLTSLGINPRQEETWRRVLNVEIAMDALDEAIAHGYEALDHFPGHPVLNYFIGMAHFLKDDTENARAHLEEALNNSESQNDYVKSMIYGALGDLYHKVNMVEVSDAAYEEAIKLDSTNVSALNNLAYYLSLRGEKLEKAAEYASRANKLSPGSNTFQDTYAWVLFQQGDYVEANKWIEKALKSGTPSAVILEHYGDILVKLGKKREAVKQWERALNQSAEDESVNKEKLKQKIREKKYVE